MKALKYVVAVVSAFLLLSMSALAADTKKYPLEWDYALLVAGGNEYRDPWTISGDTISSPIFTSVPSGNFSVPCYYKPFSLVPGKVYQLDFSISSYYCPLISSEVIVNLVGQGGYYTRISLMGNYDPGSFRLSATGYFTVDEAINLKLGYIRAFSFGLKGASTSTGLMSLQLDVTTSLYSEISNSDILGSVEEITGAINEQTGEIVGKIDEVTDEILHGYDAPDFSGNQSTIDDYNNKEHELIDGTADGKNEMESINNNALSAITSHVGAFVSVAQMMNDFINGHWFTNGLFTISASVGLLAVLLGAGVFAVGRFSGRQHSDARYEARRADRRVGRGR